MLIFALQRYLDIARRILLNVAELLNNTFVYFLTFIYRIVSLSDTDGKNIYFTITAQTPFLMMKLL